MTSPGIDKAMEAQIAAGAAVGAVTMVVSKDAILHQAAHGRHRADQDRPMALDAVFQIASMTKALGCAAAWRLIEQGRLSLDTDVEALLPDLAALPILDGFDGEVPRLRPARRRITLRQLMSHSAGLGYDIWSPDLARYCRLAGIERRAGRRALAAIPRLREPGERWEYSLSIDWVGLVVEAVTGEPIDAFLARELFGPLGMTSTAVVCDAEMEARRVPVHAPPREAPSAPLEVRDMVFPVTDFHSMGGCLRGTAPDYARFLRMVLGGGEIDGTRVFAPETVAAWARNEIGDLRVRDLPTAIPSVSAPFSILPGLEKTHSSVFMRLEEDNPGGRRAGSLFWAGLFNTWYWVDPEAGLGAILMTQASPFASPQALGVLAAFEAAVYRDFG